jgi:hypothetical protein
MPPYYVDGNSDDNDTPEIITPDDADFHDLKSDDPSPPNHNFYEWDEVNQVMKPLWGEEDAQDGLGAVPMRDHDDDKDDYEHFIWMRNLEEKAIYDDFWMRKLEKARRKQTRCPICKKKLKNHFALLQHIRTVRNYDCAKQLEDLDDDENNYHHDEVDDNSYHDEDDDNNHSQSGKEHSTPDIIEDWTDPDAEKKAQKKQNNWKAQDNPLHAKCKTCPVCRKRFQSHKAMWVHVLGKKGCANQLEERWKEQLSMRSSVLKTQKKQGQPPLQKAHVKNSNNYPW